jgi:hypothetical protein
VHVPVVVSGVRHAAVYHFGADCVAAVEAAATRKTRARRHRHRVHHHPLHRHPSPGARRAPPPLHEVSREFHCFNFST